MRLVLLAFVLVTSSSVVRAETYCRFVRGGMTCQTAQEAVQEMIDNGPSAEEIEANAARRARDAAESAARERTWKAECAPTKTVDKEGITRYVYARPGCDMKAVSR